MNGALVLTGEGGRAAASEVLACLGDSRPEVTIVDAMPFCSVPPGSFLLGSTLDDALAWDGEKRQTEYSIAYAYWISRFPATVAQFFAL